MLLFLLMVISILFGQDEELFEVKLNELTPDKSIEIRQKALTSQKQIIQAIDGFCINVSVALIAAGLVIVTVERRSNKQREEQYQKLLKTIESEISDKLEVIEKITLGNIKDLTTASQDYMISSLIYHKNIFNQVKNHLIRQDIILKKYQVRVSFQWYNIPEISYKEKLLEKVHIEYSICNISPIIKTYLLKTYVPNNSNLSLFMPHISKYTVDGINHLIQDIQIQLDLQRQAAEQKVGFEEVVEIKPNSEVHVVIEFETARNANDHELFVSSHIADNMELQVTNHPEEINISCEPYHTEELIKPSEGNVMNLTWRINHGILPYQGIKLFWKRQ